MPCLLSRISGVDFRQALSLSWGRYKTAVSASHGPDGEMWVKEDRSLCDLCLDGGEKEKLCGSEPYIPTEEGRALAREYGWAKSFVFLSLV